MIVWGDGGNHYLCCVELLFLVSYFGLVGFVGWFTCLIGFCSYSCDWMDG